MNKPIIVVSKKYAEHEIKHTVKYHQGDIEIQMPLDDFLSMLASEVDGLPFVFTKEQLKNKMLLKSKKVIGDMKESSVHNLPSKPI